jgi:hypothetical protein
MHVFFFGFRLFLAAGNWENKKKLSDFSRIVDDILLHLNVTILKGALI